MILPLLVFIVVLLAVLISFKREHFQIATTSANTVPLVTTSGSNKNEGDVTNISFIINNSSYLYSSSVEDLSGQTSMTNAIISAILQEFNDMDLDGSLISVIYNDLENEPTATSMASGSTTQASINKSEVLVTIPKYYASLFLSTHINNLKSTFFGELNNQITLSATNIVEMYAYNDGEFVKYSSTEHEEPAVTSSPTITSSSTEDVRKPLTKEELLSKKACVHSENKCNIGFKPYSMLEFNVVNPSTNKPFTTKERNIKIEQMSERCSNEKDSEEQMCCDPNDYKLQAIYSKLPGDLRRKYKKVVVDKCNNKINEIKICKGDNCNLQEDVVRPATAYELCKLQNVSDADINDAGIVDSKKLVPDCYEGKCVNTYKLLEINPGDTNERVTNHYYLIDAVKNGDLNYIKSYYSDKYNNVNESLEYGYPGNTIIHQTVYDEMNDILDYLLTFNVDMAKTNKDGNSALHIACFKGNYNAVHRLIKLGASVNCSNNMGDTPLHCAIRSGSYNTVLILINNGASAVLSHRNEHGETPLHTAVVSNKKNLKIIELLVENGSDVHNINKYEKTILGSLEDEPLTVSKESIRTFLQRIYYNKYDEEEYNKILKNFPETRPFEVDTAVPEGLEDDYDSYNPMINYKELISYDNDEYVSDKDLYVKKNTRAIKDKIPSKYFNNKNDSPSIPSSIDDDSFNTGTEKYNKKPSNNNSDEYTEENVNVEYFSNNDDMNDKNLNDLENKEAIKINILPSNDNKALIYGSFGSLSILIIILIVIYLRRTK